MVRVRMGTQLDNAFQRVFRSEGLQLADVGPWMSDRGVKYEIGYTMDYFTFPDHEAWVQFKLSWLL